MLTCYQTPRVALGGISGNTAPPSKKRKSDDALGGLSAMDDIDLDGETITENCDQVRRKINRFLDCGEMGKGAFAETIGSSSTALNRFLSQSGRDKGSGSEVFLNAWAFFKKRDMMGLKMPTKKQKTAANSTAGTKAKAGAKGGSSAAVDISDIHLEGEEDDAVPVYETCDEVRRKINAHLKKPGVTQAQFCRDMYAQLHSEKKPGNIGSSQLTRFRNNKGPRAGSTSSVFYGAYVFFEKIRVKEGKPKSKHREEMERIWAKQGGFDREHDGRAG